MRTSKILIMWWLTIQFFSIKIINRKKINTCSLKIFKNSRCHRKIVSNCEMDINIENLYWINKHMSWLKSWITSVIDKSALDHYLFMSLSYSWKFWYLSWNSSKISTFMILTKSDRRNDHFFDKKSGKKKKTIEGNSDPISYLEKKMFWKFTEQVFNNTF